MNEEPEIQGTRDLKRATRWCVLAWGCILFGGGAMPFQGIVPVIGGGILAMSGLIFSAVAAFLSLLGVIFPGGVSRLRFLLILGLSFGPYLSMTFFFLPAFGTSR